MRRGWPLIVVAFGGLICLMAGAGVVLYRYVGSIRIQVESTQGDYVERTKLLEGLRTDILSLAVELRDYLLNPAEASGAVQRRRLFQLRDSIQGALTEAGRRLGPEYPVRLERLKRDFAGYWGSVEVVLSWTPSEKRAKAPAFLRQTVLPSRDALLTVTNEIGSLNAATLERRQAVILGELATIQSRLVLVLGVVGLTSLLVALITVIRMRSLENRTEHHRRQTEDAADELRRLSHRLVKAQEDERRSISRELHDEIGQMLTALKMELGHTREAAAASGTDGGAHLQAADGLVEQLLRGVREMARGLRPAMLDELGLAAALRWHTREFSQRSGIAVDMQVEGDVDGLPERYRTCIYRVAQEALTNCARHARAGQVRFTLHSGLGRFTMTVQDDGVGFDRAKLSGKGLGLLGMEERVRELGGELTVFSEPHHGTLLRIELPLEAGVSA